MGIIFVSGEVMANREREINNQVNESVMQITGYQRERLPELDLIMKRLS